MPHQHASVEETVDASHFAEFDIVAAYHKTKDVYPAFTEGDEGRLKALEWAMSELESTTAAAVSLEGRNARQSYCIDIGCAHGQPVVERLAGRGHQVVGVDLSEGLLDLARHNLAHLPTARFQLADVRAWEPPVDRRDGEVDLVTTFYVLGHLPLKDYETVVEKMVGWLKPGSGLLVLATVARMHGWVTTRAATFPHTSLTLQQNTSLVQRLGCDVVEAWEEEWSSRMVNGDSRTHQFVCARKRY